MLLLLSTAEQHFWGHAVDFAYINGHKSCIKPRFYCDLWHEYAQNGTLSMVVRLSYVMKAILVQ